MLHKHTTKTGTHRAQRKLMKPNSKAVNERQGLTSSEQAFKAFTKAFNLAKLQRTESMETHQLFTHFHRL